MKFGISFFPDCGPQDMAAQDYYTKALDLCAEADQLGFYSARIVEHYFHSYGGYSPSPITFLAAASQRTQQLRLVTGCVLPAFHHPLHLATQLAMLDGLSHGRLDIGIARAFLPHEFHAFGIDLNESHERFEEGITALKLLWQDEHATLQGKFHTFENVHCLPHVTQQPHPPIWIAVTQTPASFRWTGQQGFNLMSVVLLADFRALSEKLDLYRKAYYEAGHGIAHSEQIMLGYPLFIASSQAAAEKLAEHYLTRYLKVFADAARGWDNLKIPAYHNYQDMANHISSMTFERVLQEQRALIGTPQRIRAQIEQLKERFGADYISLQVLPGGMPYATAQEGLHLFAREVLPHFTDSTLA
jgi:alkanesulfonate monooxygenase SsuD/methylene tetrahydromethanopterin reductase-like flavin-dependent oxidoreductase (luciferase family)